MVVFAGPHRAHDMMRVESGLVLSAKCREGLDAQGGQLIG